jgi:hypothetical protein
MVEKEHIDLLFEKALRALGEVAAPGTKEIFNILIKHSLEYRDELVKRGEPPLTVEEVKQSLNYLQLIVTKGSVPKDMPQRLIPLLQRWLTELTPKNKQ